MRFGLTAAGAAHDLVQTSMWNTLRQRFYASALEAPAAAATEGWTDVDPESMVEAIDILLKDWEVSRSEIGGHRAWLATLEERAVLVTLDSDGEFNLAASGESEEAVVGVLNRLRAVFPVPDLSAANAVAVRYWALGQMGPFSYTRRLDVTPWADAAPNYPTAIRGVLEGLMRLGEPDSGGRLALMHGPAGTGKTNLIKALAYEWRDWCDVDYIVDADKFFGEAAYMVSAMIMGADDSRWRVVVIEDAGEFLVAKANERVGQGLARLLNLSDGLVGQGLKLLVLMTTNEDASELHPAVIRPGRCFANVAFGPFDQTEATDWLQARGLDRKASGPATLAELYEITRG